MIISLVAFVTSISSAQSGIRVTGNTYVHSNGEFGVHGNLVFDSNGAGTYPGIITTNRNSLNPGAISFGEKGQWQDANDTQHVDGFVKVYTNNPFTFPIGNLGYYKPVSISGGFGTMASYSFDNPLKLASVTDAVSLRAFATENDESFLQISDTEYWDIRGKNEVEITFYWDVNSEIERLSNGDLSTLALVGWNGSSWEVISSSVDNYMIDINDFNGNKSSLVSDTNFGSMTTETIVPDDYDLFTFAAISNSAISTEVEFGSERFEDERIELTVFPNPTINLSELNLDYDVSEVSSDTYMIVLDEVGSILYRQQLANDKGIIKLPFDESTASVYHVGIVSDNGSKVFKPVVVVK